MKILTALLSLVGLGVFIACKLKPNFKSAANSNTLLWEVSGNGINKPSYFLGTMHLMCAEDAVLTEATKKIIKQVKNIYLEVDLDNAGELLSGVMDVINMRKENLEELLPEAEYLRVKDFFEKHQPAVPFSIIEKQHPLMISSSLYEMFLTCEKKNGVELMIVNEAYAQKKEIKGLETVAFQLSIFNKIPYDEQANELVKTIDSIDKHKALLGEMLQVYKEQDIQKLYTITTTEEAGTSAYLEILLDNRNENWVKQFDTLAKDESILFAVGAAHLGGEKGVINLLKKKGYTLRPLMN